MIWVVALFTRAWIEINGKIFKYFIPRSPSSRGRGLKSQNYHTVFTKAQVALFTRAWIEIFLLNFMLSQDNVALFTRAWIEIDCMLRCHVLAEVALFTRAWIEIMC